MKQIIAFLIILASTFIFYTLGLNNANKVTDFQEQLDSITKHAKQIGYDSAYSEIWYLNDVK